MSQRSDIWVDTGNTLLRISGDISQGQLHSVVATLCLHRDLESPARTHDQRVEGRQLDYPASRRRHFDLTEAGQVVADEESGVPALRGAAVVIVVFVVLRAVLLVCAQDPSLTGRS